MTATAQSRVRRWGLGFAVLVLFLGGAVAGLPWLVAHSPGHRVLAAYANSVLAPGSIEFSTIETSWFQSSVVRDVTLRDAEGDAVLLAPSLKFSWGLWQILVHRPKTADLNLVGAKLDIERRPDGTIDLRETLRPVTPEHPRIQILIHLEKSELRLRDPLLDGPLLANGLCVDIDMSRGYEPISWKVSMAHADLEGQSGRLELEGSQSRERIDRSGRHDTKVTLKGTQWPFSVAKADLGIKCGGTLDGLINADLQSDVWLVKGDTKLSRFELSAPGLAQRIELDTLSAGWDVRGTESGWTAEKLTLESSLVWLRAEGSVPALPNRRAWIEARINLADLSRYLPAALRSPGGVNAERAAARLRADLKAGTDGKTQNCDVRGTVSGLVTLEGLRELTAIEASAEKAQRQQEDEVVFSAHAKYDPHSDRLDLSGLGVTLPFAHVEGAGAIQNLTGSAQVELAGTLNPDWSALTALLADRVEPKARIAGQPRPWRVSASVASLNSNDVLDTVSGELGIQIDELDVFGMRLGNSALVARAKSGRIRLDPIDATLNQGALHIEPEMVRDQEGHRWLRLGKSSHLEGAIINDEVSHRVLSYAAPVLDGATRVKGKISARLGEAMFPITAKSDARARVAGDLILDDVRFVPGRLADQLLGVIDRKDQPLLILRDSIAIRIEDGKVHQKGLIISVADLASIGLDGSVDFDKNLDLVASLGMSRSAPIADVLPPLLQNARVDIPIRGTMQRPAIDASGFKDRIANMGMDLVGNSVEAGLDGLQRVLGGKSLKGLGDYFLPRPRSMSRPGTEKVDPRSKEARPPRTAPADPEPAPRGAEKKKTRMDRVNSEFTNLLMNTRKPWNLAVMMALVFAVQGSFWPLLAVHLADLGISGRARGWIFATLAMGSAVIPLAAGQLADRLMATEKYLALAFAAATGILVVLASGLVTGASGIFLLFLFFWTLVGPSFSLSYSLAMRNLDNPGRDFGWVRLWGTVGWMVSGWVASGLMAISGSTHMGQGAYEALWVGCGIALVASVYSLTLPHTPPLAIGRHSTRSMAESVELLRSPDMMVFLVTSFCVYLTVPLVFQVMPNYLEARGLPRAWTATVLTLGQMGEIVILALLPWFFKRFGMKGTLALGITAWFARFFSLSLNPPLWVAVAGTVLHGFGIACFTVAGQLYIDSRSRAHFRASAQALLMVCTSGIGALMGNVLAGEIAGRTSPTDVLVFLIPCVIDGAVLLYFWRGFRASVSGELAVGVADANQSPPPQRLRGSVARVGHLVTESADG